MLQIELFGTIVVIASAGGRHEHGKRESTALKQTLLYGAGSIVIYVLAFANADAFAALCAKGGLWTALPIASVLLLSYVHGHFAGALWELCGITGVQKKSAQTTAKAVARQSATPAPRLDTTAVVHG